MSLLSPPPRLHEELHQSPKVLFARRRWLWQVLLWLLVVAGLIGLNIDVLGKPLSLFFFTNILSAAGFVYTFLLWIMPYARYKRKIGVLIWLTLLNTLIWFGILFMMRRHLFHTQPTEFPAIFLKERGLIFGVSLGSMVLVIWIYFSCYYFLYLYDQQKNLNRYETALSEKIKAELAFLQSQINPHFLFNTLNNIYLLTLKRTPDAAIISRRLKELLQYMLHDCTMEKVPLAGEILFIKNYIELEKLRNRQEAIDISVEVSGDANVLEIAPLLLINFIENAFKHGVKAGIGKVTVKVRLEIDGNQLLFYISNSKPEVIPLTVQLGISESGGIGITNIRRRLQIMYPQKHNLDIRETTDSYTVSLQLTL